LKKPAQLISKPNQERNWQPSLSASSAPAGGEAGRRRSNPRRHGVARSSDGRGGQLLERAISSCATLPRGTFYAPKNLWGWQKFVGML